MINVNNIIKNRFLDKNFKNSRYESLKYSIRYGLYGNIAYSYLYLYNLDKVNYVIYFHKNKISLGKIIECFVFNHKGIEFENITITLDHPYDIYKVYIDHESS